MHNPNLDIHMNEDDVTGLLQLTHALAHAI